jgi:hypothetical protein
VSAGPCTLCGGDHARSVCPWAKPAAEVRYAIIRTRAAPSAVIRAAQAAADALERAGAEMARLRRALDNRVPIDTAAELRWRVRELEARLADQKPASAAARPPLTMEQINDLPTARGVFWPWGIAGRIVRLIRDVERAHGVGAGSAAPGGSR